MQKTGMPRMKRGMTGWGQRGKSKRLSRPLRVMARLVRAIHTLDAENMDAEDVDAQDVDAPHKAGHDGLRAAGHDGLGEAGHDGLG